jgi:hypothetical protein
MNIAMEQTEEWSGGLLKNKYGDAFIRGCVTASATPRSAPGSHRPPGTTCCTSAPCPRPSRRCLLVSEGASSGVLLLSRRLLRGSSLPPSCCTTRGRQGRRGSVLLQPAIRQCSRPPRASLQAAAGAAGRKSSGRPPLRAVLRPDAHRMEVARISLADLFSNPHAIA